MTATASALSHCDKLTNRLAETLGNRPFEMLFNHSVRFDFDDRDGKLNVVVPNGFFVKVVKDRYLESIRSAAEDAYGRAIDCDVVADAARFDRREQVSPSQRERSLPLRIRRDDETTGLQEHQAQRGRTDAARAPISRPDPERTAKRIDDPLPLKHRFEHFIVGPSNEFAHAAAHQIVEDTNADSHAPTVLFIHGGCGLGKTHLLQSICAKFVRNRPEAKVRYLTGEQFTNEFLAAIHHNRLEQFRKSIRGLDLLAIDDVRFIAGKQKTQQELQHCLDTIMRSGARVVLSSDLPPDEIKKFSEALLSRCKCGMIARVFPLDPETRTRIVAGLAKRRGMELIDGVLRQLSQRITGSVRDIEGTLTRLHAQALVERSRKGRSVTSPAVTVITRGLVDRLFTDNSPIVPARPVPFGHILRTVADKLNVTTDQIMGRCRRRPVVLARATVVHLARELRSMSYPEIATAMGRDSHSTVITAHKRLQKQVADEDNMQLYPETMEPLPIAEIVNRVRTTVIREANR